MSQWRIVWTLLFVVMNNILGCLAPGFLDGLGDFIQDAVRSGNVINNNAVRSGNVINNSGYMRGNNNGGVIINDDAHWPSHRQNRVNRDRWDEWESNFDRIMNKMGEDIERAAEGNHVLITGSTGRDSSKLYIKNYQIINYGQCTLHVTVTGPGVKDSFQEPCPRPQLNMNTRTGTICGDIRYYSFCLFHSYDSPGTLIVIRSGVCTIITYITVSGEIKRNPSSMTDDDCAHVKRRISDEANGKGNRYPRRYHAPPSPPPQISPPHPISHPTPVKASPSSNSQLSIPLIPSSSTSSIVQIPLRPPSSSSTHTSPSPTSTNPSPPEPLQNSMKTGVNKGIRLRMIITTTRRYFGFLECKLIIKAEGDGVRQTFQEPCSYYLITKLVSPEFALFGDTIHYSFCLYHEDPGTLVVIRDGNCRMNSYSNNDVTSKALSTPDCDLIGNKITKRLSENRKYSEGWYKNVVQIRQLSPLPRLFYWGAGRARDAIGKFFSL